MRLTSTPLLTIRPLLRTLVRTPVAGFAVLTATPAVVATALGHDDLGVPVALAALTAPTGLAFAVDDPADPTLSPCPTPRSTRRLTRGALVAVAMGASWAVVVVCLHLTDSGLGPTRIRLAEAAAAAALSVAFAAWSARNGTTSPGVAAVAATLVLLGASSGLALQFSWLPQVGNSEHVSRWWTVAAVASVAAWWWSRDPAARPPLHRIFRPSNDEREPEREKEPHHDEPEDPSPRAQIRGHGHRRPHGAGGIRLVQ